MSIAALQVDINVWVCQKQFDNFSMVIHGGTVKGSPLDVVCTVDIDLWMVLKSDDTSDTRPLRAAFNNFSSTGSDMHKQKRFQNNEVEGRKIVSAEPPLSDPRPDLLPFLHFFFFLFISFF